MTVGHTSRHRPLQRRPAAATVNAGPGTRPVRGASGNEDKPGPPNHAHRAEVSLVAPSGRVSGYGQPDGSTILYWTDSGRTR